jgi:ABC-type Na+ efflux pump permease subunit
MEVMVSSVRPFDLMLGKILGVASVAVVQVLIWGVLCAVGAAVAVHMMPADVLAGVQAMQHGVPDAAASIDMNPEMLQVMAAVTEQLNRFTHTCHQVLPYENYIRLSHEWIPTSQLFFFKSYTLVEGFRLLFIPLAMLLGIAYLFVKGKWFCRMF